MKKLKIILTSLTALSTTASVAFIATSCSKNQVEKFLITFELAADEYIEECPEKQMYVEEGTTYGQLPKAKKTRWFCF